jgi:hypothetical protein
MKMKLPTDNTNLNNADSPLCNLCRNLGYCRIIRSLVADNNINTPDFFSLPTYSLKDYISLVPLQVTNLRLGNYSRHYVQHAHDAFHQEDYETAILNYKAAMEGSGDVEEILIGLALSYYSIEDFENASIFMQIYNDKVYPSTLKAIASYFMDVCVSKGINRINDCEVKGELTEIGQDERCRTL